MSAAEQLRAIAAELRAAGEMGLRRELGRGLREAAAPVKAAVQQAALDRLPKSGGLAAREAAAVQVQVLTGASTTALRLRNRRLGAVQTNDAGDVRHPVFGRWLEDQPAQPIPGAQGWFTDTALREAPLVEAELVAAMERVVAKIAKVGI